MRPALKQAVERRRDDRRWKVIVAGIVLALALVALFGWLQGRAVRRIRFAPAPPPPPTAVPPAPGPTPGK